MKTPCVVILLLLPACLVSQSLHQNEAEAFVRALLYDRDSLSAWLDEESVALSHRLHVEYEGVQYKNLISYDVEDTVRKMVRVGRLGYSVTVDSLDRDNTHLRLNFNQGNLARDFYFKKKRCISPLVYFARDWTVINSTHFRFFVSDSSLFNPYCVQQLESFLVQMSVLLGLTNREIRVLQQEKIYYYLCQNEAEVERLTGYRARGMYNLAYDALVTTFSNHNHELLHLLINYKGHRLPLYAHPFLQEGFAVAYGGRGGMEPAVLLPLGKFLYRSQFVELRSLLEKEGFAQLDPSLSYPAAGLYNKFLVETISMKRYLRFYQKHSARANDQATLHIASGELPSDSAWKSYLDKSAPENTISIDTSPKNAAMVFRDGSSLVSEDSTHYHFSLSDVFLVPGDHQMPHYVSKIFLETLPDRKYMSEKFLVRANAEEISVYNLYTNNLLASYAWSFSIPPEKVPRVGGRYCFSIRKSVFDGSIDYLLGKKGR